MSGGFLGIPRTLNVFRRSLGSNPLVQENHFVGYASPTWETCAAMVKATEASGLLAPGRGAGGVYQHRLDDRARTSHSLVLTDEVMQLGGPDGPTTTMDEKNRGT